VNGIFITVELEGALAERIHALQLQHDPKLANEFPPHVTIVGSSGAGPIDPATSLDELRRTVLAITAETPAITVAFQPAMRFIGREIVVLPLDVHGPLRALHERLKMSGLRCALARWPYTPHCTLNYYATLTPESLRTLVEVREPEPWKIRQLRVYHTRDAQKAKLLFEAPLIA
jgi:2'-5' RNA ligase